MLRLTYDEDLDTSSVPAGSDFTVKVNGKEVRLADSNSVAVGTGAVTLRLADAVVHGQDVTVSYTPGANPIRDTRGNLAGVLTDSVVTNNTPDTTAPTLSGAEVNGSSLTLTYSENLKTSAVPAVSAFEVKLGVCRS